jgi:hypothetical protein
LFPDTTWCVLLSTLPLSECISLHSLKLRQSQSLLCLYHQLNFKNVTLE